jgi:hypothetical protein
MASRDDDDLLSESMESLRARLPGRSEEVKHGYAVRTPAQSSSTANCPLRTLHGVPHNLVRQGSGWPLTCPKFVDASAHPRSRSTVQACE